MKKFKFKLQTVLEFRTKQLDEVQQAFAEELQKRQELLKHVQEYDGLITKTIADQQVLMSSGEFDVFQAQQFPQFLLRLKQQRFETSHKLQIQEEIVAIKRSELKEAVIKKKSLELLKAKAQKAFNNAILKQEEEMLAEISLNKIARRIQQEQRQKAASR